VTIKRVDQGLVSNYIHDNLKIGEKLEVDKPAGSFYVEPSKKEQKQYVFFGGGSGITPIFSIIKSLLEKEPKANILLIYANQETESIIFRNKLKALSTSHSSNFHIEHIISNDCPELENYHSGFVTDALIVDLFEKHDVPFGDQSYMICGPFGFMEAVKSILNVNGVALNKIKVELFKSPTVVIDTKNLISDVEIQLNGETHKLQIASNKSILQAAMAKNIALPYSCRSGMCASCKASCISGEVKMIEGHFLEQTEVDQGMILTCVSYPASKNVVITI
jgi:ferredoxin-NADP reductase